MSQFTTLILMTLICLGLYFYYNPNNKCLRENFTSNYSTSYNSNHNFNAKDPESEKNRCCKNKKKNPIATRPPSVPVYPIPTKRPLPPPPPPTPPLPTPYPTQSTTPYPFIKYINKIKYNINRPKCKTPENKPDIDIIIEPPKCKKPIPKLTPTPKKIVIPDITINTNTDECKTPVQTQAPTCVPTQAPIPPKRVKCKKYVLPKKCSTPSKPKCKDKIILGCEKSKQKPTCGRGGCVCPNYPDMSKYILKSKMPPSPDIDNIVKERTKNLPKIDLTKYILKSKIDPCSPQPDLSKYLLKSSVPPPCKKCLDSPCGRTSGPPPPAPKPKQRVCCPARPLSAPPAEESEKCCSCTTPSPTPLPTQLPTTLPTQLPTPLSTSLPTPSLTPEEEDVLKPIPIPTYIDTIKNQVNMGINSTILTYGKCAQASNVSRQCIPFFQKEQPNNEPDPLVSGSMFK